MRKPSISYTICIMLANQKDYMNFSVSSAEHERVMTVLKEDFDDAFISFDSLSEAVAVRSEDIAVMRFLFDPGVAIKDHPKDAGENGIKVYVRGNPDPLFFGVDQDEPANRESGGGCEWGQLGEAMISLSDLKGVARETIVIEDLDGETVVFRKKCISMIRIPFGLIPGWEDPEPLG